MANHVYFNIEVSTKSPNVEVAFKNVMVMEEYERQLFNSDETYKVEELIDIDKLAFMPRGEYDKDDWLENSYDYYVDNVGAKWCNIDYVDHDSLFFSGYSAWSPPITLIENLQNYLEGYGEVDIRMTYEDEGWCFVGVADGRGEYEELDDGEILQPLRDELGIEELPDDWESNEEIADKLDYDPREWVQNEFEMWFERVEL